MKPKWVVIHAPHLAPKKSERTTAAPARVSAHNQINYGPPLWQKLHQRALAHRGEDAAWLAKFETSVPCGNCRKNWKEMMQRTPPNWDDYFAWTVARHNEINVKLGKPTITPEVALARWLQN